MPKNKYTQFADQRYVSASNGSGQDIPPWAALEITGMSEPNSGEYVLTVTQPTSDSATTVCFASRRGIPSGKVGLVTLDMPAFALYDSGGGTPAVGDKFGTQSGSFKLLEDNNGFLAISTAQGSGAGARIRVIEDPDGSGSNLQALFSTIQVPVSTSGYTWGGSDVVADDPTDILTFVDDEPVTNTKTLIWYSDATLDAIKLELQPTSTFVSANDTTPGVLNGKLVAGTNITLVEGSDGGDETLTINASGGGSNALLDGSSHTDTVAQGVTRGSLIYGNATPKWDELVIGTATYFLQSDGTDAAWGTINALTADGSPDASADYLMSWDADASAHKKILLSNLPAHGANGLGNLEWRSSSAISYTAFSAASTGPVGVSTTITLAEGEHVQAAYLELTTQFTGGTVSNTPTEHGDSMASASTDNHDMTTSTAAKKYFANSLYSSPLQADGTTGSKTLYVWMSSVGDNLDQLTAGSLKAHYLIGTCP